MEEHKRRTTIHHCARCGQDHIDMEFKMFNGDPIEDQDGTVWDWWGICPITGDPVLQNDPPEVNVRDHINALRAALGDGGEGIT